MNGDGMANRYDVNIAGYPLTVMSERSQEHMTRLAETLNGRVREIQRSGGTANYLHVVMLAAMELADEVLEFRDRTGGLAEKARESGERAARIESEASGLREEVRRLGEESFALIEKKIVDLVQVVSALKKEKAILTEELASKEGEVKDLGRKLAEMTRERNEVKDRVEKILSRLDSIEL
jgi:cell division protein ZapA (FtsZ GTPase activity inhibitor)